MATNRHAQIRYNILDDVDLVASKANNIANVNTIVGLGLGMVENKFLKGIDFEFYRNAPEGKFGGDINGVKKYWSNNFRGGTRAGILGEEVAEAKIIARTSVRAGNAFNAVGNGLSALGLIMTGYEVYYGWETASNSQKIFWIADGVMGILAYTPLSPISGMYFGTKLLMSWASSSRDPRFMGNYNVNELRQVKIDNLRVHNNYLLIK
ncbi:hypothetical protein ACG2LH_16075 [Zhouia sp. PK063]|uniref:hypothetical protein n=1 Tax=Zhouia sp. PK063 TaxID=3373602 RepID=UPI0037B6CB2D